MAYKSIVECDECHNAEDSPDDGGFPAGWIEINTKPSLRGDNTAKRRRFHLCGRCAKASLPKLLAGVAT